MRARTGRIAVVMLSSISVCGCSSSPSWSHFSLWGKKPDNAAVADAPKFNPANPALPSANQNPSNSLASTTPPNAALAAAAGANAAAAPGMTGYGAMPAAYQNSAYPTTPYQQAKLPATAGAPSAAVAPGANVYANGSAAGWNGGSQIPGPAVGYGAASTMPSRYAPGSAAPANGAMPQNQMASAPGYGSATAAATAPTATTQPQAGFYNPTYDGGAAANRYASGTPIPNNVSASSMAATPQYNPATQPQYNPAAGNSMPNNSAPDYRTADARSGAPATAGADAGTGSAPGDRYAGFNNNSNYVAPATAAPTNVAPQADRYSIPATAPNAAPSGIQGVGDRYSQPAGGAQPPAGAMDQGSSYQPGTMATPIGATGYNPTDNAYSTTAGSAMPSLPSRGNSEYRPGGTSNYVSPTGNAVQPASTDSHTPGVVSPAGFQSASTGNAQSHTGVTLASATAPIGSSSAVYGAYQGGSSATTPAASSFSSSSEPAYGAPNPVAATPALLSSQPAQ